jgi:RHS repeat-associated protein
MNGFFTITNRLFKTKNIKNLGRKIAVICLLTALLVPVTAPIPAWAQNLNNDDGLELTPAAPSLAAMATGIASGMASQLASFISPFMNAKEKGPESVSTEALEKRAISIEVQITGGMKIERGGVLSLAALPIDKSGQVVNGVAARWKSSDPEIIEITDDLQAVALKKGEATLTVFLGKLHKEVSIEVTGEAASRTERQAKVVAGKASHGRVLNDPFQEPVITEQQAENLVTPENNLGTPVGQTEMGAAASASATRTRERAGNANFGFGIPLASLPGRGINASVGVTYNSRVWNKATFGATKIFDFNTAGNWLAPGFETGYGYLEGFSTSVGNGVGYLLTKADGSRQQLFYKQTLGTCAVYESTDGSYLQTTVCGGYSASTIKVLYPDGSQVTYGAITASSKRFPVSISDRNGNLISIAYLQSDTVGKIAYVRDTLNRYITFNYDNTPEKKLVAVTVPGFNDSTIPRQTIRFYYEDMALQWQNRFDNNNTQVNAPNTITVLRWVYFPGNQSGFRYDYSPYFGMVYKISQRRGMQISEDVNSPTSLTQTGTVLNEGIEAALTHYNYPATPMDLGGIPLVDVPKYSWRKDDWAGRTTSIPQTFFNTEEQTQANPQGIQVGSRITKNSSPDGTTNVSISNIKPGEWDNGLVTETKLITTENNQERIWSRTKMYWQQGINQPQGRDNPRLNKIEIMNDIGQIRATSFEYDSYNNQTVVREHDFAPEGSLGTELRRTETIYETGAGWINNRQLRLPKIIKTVVNEVTVSKVVYEYDNYTNNELVPTPGVTQYLNSYNLYDAGTHTCNCHWSCNGELMKLTPESPSCPDGSPPFWVCEQCSNYNPNTIYRGNITKVTSFSDATLETDSNAVITTMKYDMTGNLVEAGASCCKLKTWSYSSDTGYAYTVSESRGNAGQLSTSKTYDRNTGLVKTSIDENNQPIALTYDPSNLRLIRADYPNGAWSSSEYNDSIYPFYVKQTTSLDANRSLSSWSFVDGRGQDFRFRGQTLNGYLTSDTEFDIMGRAFRAYNAYTVTNLTDPRPQDIKFREITQMDGLSRTLRTTLADQTSVQASYSGMVATITDQSGKSRRQISDPLGRIIRADEPDASGNLGDVNSPAQPTYYEYDGNNNLVKITQTGNGATQERLFKFDSLSRLTHEREVEARASLNDDGVKLKKTGSWTSFYKYDTDGLVTYHVDARGVKASFTYDGLNRMKTVTYTGEVGYQTPATTYTYDEERPNYYNKGRLTKVQVAAVAGQETPELTQVYDFDKAGQIVNHTQSIGNQSYTLHYSFNLAGQMVSEQYPSGKVVNMTIDNFGRTSAVADAQRTYLNGRSFNAQGLPSQISLGNGTTETFSYNDRLQVSSQSLLKGAEVLQKYDYAYGQADLAGGNVDATKNNGQLGRIESFIGAQKQWSQRFGYDSLGRLSEAREYKQGDNNQLSYKQKFDFDRFGNLYRKAVNNPTAGQLSPLPFTPIEDADIDRTKNRLATNTVYDEAGNVVADNLFRNSGFSYDGNGRQTKVTRANTPDALTIYDALGNRVATKIYDVWRYMVYDAFGKLVAEYGAQSEEAGGVKYIQQDSLGSVRTVTNNNGFVVSRTDYQAFGEEIGLGVGLRSVEQGYTGDKATKLGYAMTESDEASGLNHTLFRKNEPRAGRWTSPDPYRGSMSLLNPQSFNRYSYAANQPTNFVDPSGLMIIAVCSWWAWFTVDAQGNPIEQISAAFQICDYYYIPDYGGGSNGGHSGGGTGGGTGTGNGAGNSQTGIAQACIDALKELGIWDRVQEILKNPPLIDIDNVFGLRGADGGFMFGNGGKQAAEGGYFPWSMGSNPGSAYFGSLAGPGETVGQVFDRNSYEGGAWTVRGYGVDGIYYRGSQSNILQNIYFMLHEVVHLAYPPTISGRNGPVDLDEALITDLSLNRRPGESATDTVSRFFNSQCPNSQRFGNTSE